MTDFDPPRISNGTFTNKAQSAAPRNTLPKRSKESVFSAVPINRAGFYRVESGLTTPQPVDGYISIPQGGFPHINARLNTITRLYTDADRDEARAIVAGLGSQHVADEKVTILVEAGHGSGRGTSPGAEIIEGSIHTFGDGSKGLVYKGKGDGYAQIGEGTDLGSRLLGVRLGHGKQRELAAEFDQKAAKVPVTVPATFDGIPDRGGEFLDENVQETIAAVFIVEADDLGAGREPGCMFLATDIQTDSGIVNGYFWSPTDASQHTSEFSSMYVEDQEWNGHTIRGLSSVGGRLRDYEPNSYSATDAWEKLSEDRVTGYAEILGR